MRNALLAACQAGVLVAVALTSRDVAGADPPSSVPAGTGRSYRVDFGGGSDDGDGLSAATAFKHCPGDPAATGKAKAATLAAGDAVLFKGGVRYRGMIEVRSSGQEGKPIVFDGNSGRFGQARAVIDGSDPLSTGLVARRLIIDGLLRRRF